MEQLRKLDESVTHKPTVISLVVGIIAGLIGIGIIAIAYPMYSYALKREREKVAPEIIRLTDELLK